MAIQVTINGTSILCGKEGWKEEDGKNYRYLNKWTIRNNYPLLLISDVLENIGMKKVFTKMDLRWGYHNIRIKERDEWKVVFTTPKGSFEPMVIVVATTRCNGTRSMLTSAKLSVGYLVVGITRELDKEPLLHCSSIYINYMWSVLQQY